MSTVIPAACTPHVSGNSAARARSRSKILSAAKALFLEDGYDGVNLDRIATRAGVARQTVYNRFGGKEAVFRAVVEHHWASLDLDTLPARFEEGLGSGGDPAGFLRRFSRALLAFIDETDQIAFTRLVIAESSRIPWIAGEFHRLGKAPLLRGISVVSGASERGRRDLVPLPPYGGAAVPRARPGVRRLAQGDGRRRGSDGHPADRCGDRGGDLHLPQPLRSRSVSRSAQALTASVTAGRAAPYEHPPSTRSSA
ncbi:TetR/AcrR family transcriptional regulator [Streptomyces sp. HUAS TT20]|uniref:TetR/AcrR family transcriptional regulator n=1 Tax=Streptomyces sp. HUAS TT20 TaxID=3447509 RepID=UPI003F68A257